MRAFPGLHLKPHLVRILCTLWEARGRTVSYETLHPGSRAALTAYISKLRQALSDVGSDWVIVLDRDRGVALRELKPISEESKNANSVS